MLVLTKIYGKYNIHKKDHNQVTFTEANNKN